MSSSVYFIDLRASFKKNLMTKIDLLLDAAGMSEIIKKKDLVAVKLHFGEAGNAAFIRPIFIRQMVGCVKKAGGDPFLTDANTLYAGTRSDTPAHIRTAIQNGFAFSVVDAPIIIADGLRGKSETAVTVNRKHFKKVYIGTDIIQADALVSVAHFKGHELSGFGGTIKNLGMGCASRRGKMAQHSGLGPKVVKKKCVGCGECIGHCSQSALSLKKKKAVIDAEKCIGCGECILICSNKAVQVRWNQSVPLFMEKMIEYTEGVLKNKVGKSLFINVINNVSPACDCPPFNDAPIVRDIGFLAGTDPIAVDRASVDLVNAEKVLEGSCLKTNTDPGEDKFRGIYPKVDWDVQFDYAEQIGLGTCDYKLVKI
ncbi:DUF362 domain-containing protein [Desulfococcaceae bacterium HSG7]|nr:DUF362 domain-containing protein [Desulfococcaceae bacterium HSG7]